MHGQPGRFVHGLPLQPPSALLARGAGGGLGLSTLCGCETLSAWLPRPESRGGRPIRNWGRKPCEHGPRMGLGLLSSLSLTGTWRGGRGVHPILQTATPSARDNNGGLRPGGDIRRGSHWGVGRGLAGARGQSSAQVELRPLACWEEEGPPRRPRAEARPSRGGLASPLTWAADRGLNPCLLQHRDPVDGAFDVLAEHVPVQVEEAKGKLV